MWAVGAILAELFTLSPLFPGESETDQLYKICTVLGTPDCTVWPEGMNLPRSSSFKFFQIPPRNLWELIPNASLEAIDLIQRLCSWDPRRRPTAEQALQHPFFNVCNWVPRPVHDASHTKTNEPKAHPKLELNLWDFSTEPDDCFLDLTLSLKPSFPGTGFWPLVPSDRPIGDVPAMPSWQQAYMVDSQASLPGFSGSPFGLSLQPSLWRTVH
ncbi:hypothetical protein PVAP13_9KG013041 [Panicum virgatum]|uniref:Protein kinase domain-containing protein n=1 Tax=Panicum virgatum TaxID=38727 RepID=A0A8T0N7Y5_PANVG|nr:hypothetical protein PVAP13_9KG013041 [Panicum virgatum]